MAYEKDDTTEDRFKLWLLDTCASLDNGKIDFKKFLRMLELGSRKAYALLYGKIPD